MQHRQRFNFLHSLRPLWAGAFFLLMPPLLHARAVTLPVHGLKVVPEEPVPIEAEWNESWFFQTKTSEYNHNIARIAVLLSEISYVLVEKNPAANAMLQTYRILGFDDKNTEWNYILDYSVSDKENDQAAYSFSYKEVKTTSGTKKLVFAVLRGTPLSANEWISNINVSNTTHKNRELHEGFFNTAQSIKKAFCDYLEKNAIHREEAVFLITGHSRGAALANLLGATLADEGILSPEQLFVYTFASPNVSQSEKTGDSRYNFIWNIVNAEDIVPTIPPNRNNWKWKKFGNMKILANYWNTNPDSYNTDYIPRINRYYNKLLLRDYAPFKSGPFFQIQIGRILTQLYKKVENYYGSVLGLHGIAEDAFWKIFPEKSEEKEAQESDEEKLPFFVRLARNNINKNTDAAFDYAMNALVDMHACESYLSVLLALNESEAFSTLGSTQILINGSYDCAIFDENGTLLGRILDGSAELYTVKVPLAIMPLPGKNAIGFPGNQNLSVIVYKGSLLPTRVGYTIEYYDAVGGLLEKSEKSAFYLRANHAIRFEAGKVTLEEKTLSSVALSSPETKPLIKEYGIKRNFKFTVAPEFSVTTAKIFSLGLRAGTQEIYGTALGELHSHDALGFSLGLGHQQSLYGRILLDTEAFARFVWAEDETENKDFSLVPMARVSLAYKPRRNVQFFAGAAFDFHIDGFNDSAFTSTARRKTLSTIDIGEKSEVFPSFLFGIRL